MRLFFAAFPDDGTWRLITSAAVSAYARERRAPCTSRELPHHAGICRGGV